MHHLHESLVEQPALLLNVGGAGFGLEVAERTDDVERAVSRGGATGEILV